ncbi:MAG1360 family OppF-related protein, partial [Mycoplasma tauri]
KLILLESQYNFVKKFANANMFDIKKGLIIRDKTNAIRILEDMLKKIKNDAIEELKYLINKYKHKMHNDKERANLFEKSSPQYRFLIKKTEVEKHIYKLLTNNFKKLQFLSVEEIHDLGKNLNYELKYFINNNLSSFHYNQKSFNIPDIRFEISENFTFNIESYITSSEQTEKNILKNIRKNKEIIAKTKEKFYKVNDDYKFDVLIKDLKTEINQQKSRIEWRKKLEKNKHDIFLKNNKEMFDLIFKTDEIFEKISKKIQKIGTPMWFLKKWIFPFFKGKNTDFMDFYNEIQKFKNTYNGFSSLFGKFISLLKTLLEEENISRKKIKESYLFMLFIDIFDKSGIPVSNIVSDIEDVSYFNKVKMAFISKFVNKPKLVIVEDDINNKDFIQKNKLIEDMNRIAKSHDSSFLFLTNNKELLNQSFDFCFMIVNNKEIEYGSIKSILTDPINPIVKFNILGKNIPKDAINVSDDNFIFSDEIKINNEHFLISTYNQFKSWTTTKKQDSTNDAKNLVENARDQEKTISVQLENLITPFYNEESIIIDIKKSDIENNEQMIKTSNLIKEFENMHKMAKK